MIVMIGTPAYSGVEVRYVHSLKRTLEACKAEGIDVILDMEEGSSLIAHARNNTARRFLQSGADVLVFIDSDLEWNPEDFIRLVKSKHHIAACAYRFKKDPERYTCLIYSGKYGTPIVDDGWIVCQAAGTGFMKIDREAFELIRYWHPELSYKDEHGDNFCFFNNGLYNGVYYGEDYNFCRLYSEHGDQIYVWPDADMTHIGKGKYSGNLHQFLLAQPKP